MLNAYQEKIIYYLRERTCAQVRGAAEGKGEAGVRDHDLS